MKQPSLAQELQNLQKNRQFLAIMVLLFVCVMFWTGITLFASQRSTKLDEHLVKLAEPLNPTLDEAVISQIEAKQYSSSEELTSFPIYKIILTTEGDKIVPIDTPEDFFDKQSTGQETNFNPSASPEADSAPTPTPSLSPSPDPSIQP